MKRALLLFMQGKKVYQVIVRVTGAVIGTYTTRKRASTACDKKDNSHGSYAHSVKEVTQ